jgi:protein CpxP
MKSCKYLALLCGLTMTLAAAVAFAQTSATPPMGQGGEMRNGMGGQQARGRLQWMAQQLNLTEDQKEKLRPILMKEGMELKTLRDDTSMSPEDKHEKMKGIHDKYRPDIRAILTPEQQQKFDQMKEEGMERHKEMKGGAMSNPNPQ